MRSLDEFVDALPIALAVNLFVLVAFFATQALQNRLRKNTKKFWSLFILALPGVALLLAFIEYCFFVGTKEAYYFLLRVLPEGLFITAFVGAAVLSVGFVLFKIRSSARFCFGLLEAIIGIWISIQRIPVTGGDPFGWGADFFWATLTAGVFLVVRGFDNMSIGLKPETYDSFLQSFKDYEQRMSSRFEEKRSAATDRVVPAEKTKQE